MSTTSAMRLASTDLVLGYGQRTVVDGIAFDVAPGECVALVGSNGAGKSTTLKALVGIHPVRAGTVSWGGQNVTGWRPAQAVRAGVTLCPEGRHLFPAMSVRDNLLMGSAKTRLSRQAVRAALEEAETLFPVLHQREKQLAGTLSGGEQQMVAIGRALMSRPRLLILDEPSLGLAPLLIERMFESIAAIVASGCSVLIAEQNVEATLTIADRAYVMEAGRIVMSGVAAELRENPELAATLLGASPESVPA